MLNIIIDDYIYIYIYMNEVFIVHAKYDYYFKLLFNSYICFINYMKYILIQFLIE